ncbi:AraC family transcriptional regulator [Maribacter algicola]|uniref:AraC family transcriptional regulator n=1 Tax=Maribacter algicola TaxID=2498892 RepID=A0A426RHZ2_9FLAO|nr:AraC family transcriptional regulator [Maribacter algicola]RRQ48604.1 AraC family transcriptional regulator [Maribacter algicola]
MNPILEAIPLGKEKSILGFQYEAPNFETPWHFHPQHELTYIEESVGTKLIGDFVGPYEPGELVLLHSNLPHCWKNINTSEKESKSIVVQWNKGIFSKVPELDAVFDMLRQASKGILFDKKDSARLLPLLQNLPFLEGSELYMQLLQLLTQLSKCSYETISASSFMNDLPTEHGSRMSKTHDFVANNYQRKIFLKELADLVNMSEQSFSRFFVKMMGRSFFTFLNEYRINMAVRMLLDTDYSVSQIGYTCGYESLPFFYKQFNKFKGSSPLVYRKRYRKY